MPSSSQHHSGEDARCLPPEGPTGLTTTRSPDPDGPQLKLDRTKLSDVPHLRMEDSVVEKPDAIEPAWGWQHPTRRRIDPQRSGNAGTCAPPWCNFSLLRVPRNDFSREQTLASDGY